MTHSSLISLLQILADGRFHSGQNMAAALECSRATIWGMINRLKSMGMDIHALRGRGYRLSIPLELLNKKRLQEILRANNDLPLVTIEILEQVDSTNNYVLQSIQQGLESPHLCLTEYQSGGRGRRGRKWVSPFAHNIYLSLFWRFNSGPAQLTGLSLVIAIAIAQGLESMGIVGIGLKWPNDVHLEGKKLAGILIEVSGESEGPSNAVIGIGLNMSMSERAAVEIDQPWTTVLSQLPGISRNECAAIIISHLIQTIHRFEEEGFPAFLDLWRRYDTAMNKKITVQLGDSRIQGIGLGVDAFGMLLIDDGIRVRHIASGEVSMSLQG